MAQLTLRAGDELIGRVRRAAAWHGQSMNAYVTAVLDVATDPDRAGSEPERLRERLARVGLLVPPKAGRRRPPRGEVARARAVAGSGTPLSQLVSEGR